MNVCQQIIEETGMTPIERLVVTLAACCTIKEVHRLKLFFVSLERERKKVAR